MGLSKGDLVYLYGIYNSVLSIVLWALGGGRAPPPCFVDNCWQLPAGVLILLLVVYIRPTWEVAELCILVLAKQWDSVKLIYWMCM